MSENIKCKKLIATFQDDNLMLEGPKYLEFHIDENISIEIKLLMLFDGRFITLKQLLFEDSEEGTSEHLKSYASNIMKTRLSYYNSADFCMYTLDKLVDYEKIVTEELFSAWQELLKELDIVHQMFLYSISDSKTPVDMKCAFLIELSEPLVEIVKENTHFYSSLNPGERGTPLKMCIDALISKYGTDIFAKEIASNYDKFLQIIVNSRVRIMHIKRHQKGLFFNGSESVLYAQKMAVLYRRILFEILGMNKELYESNLKTLINSLDNWKDVQEKFLKKLN